MTTDNHNESTESAPRLPFCLEDVERVVEFVQRYEPDYDEEAVLAAADRVYRLTRDHTADTLPSWAEVKRQLQAEQGDGERGRSSNRRPRRGARDDLAARKSDGP